MARAMTARREVAASRFPDFDHGLAVAAVSLFCIGLVMVCSASIEIAAENYGDPYYHLRRHLVYASIGATAFVALLGIPFSAWERHGWVLLPAAFILLTLVLVPGIGREVNGSMRWISLGPVNLQASELARIGVVIYMAGYLVRQSGDVRTRLAGLAKPMAVVSLLVVLLLMEPDFGTAVVLIGAVLGMVFLSGVRLLHFSALIVVSLGSVFLMAVSQPYRMQRLTAFTDPWADPFNSGYQLTQALIAFGRGEWFGVGLGNSVQKLFYLPEAHTDFVFAILAEETGLVGSIVVIALYVLLIGRSMRIGRRCERAGLPFHAYLVWGIALMFAAQAFINMGVNAGLLPTKGITLPFLSFGGSSLLASCMALALVFRADYECRQRGTPGRGA